MWLPSCLWIIIRELTNCLYDVETDFQSAGQRPTAADSIVAQGPDGALSPTTRRRPGERRRMRPVDRAKAPGQPADRQRSPQPSGPGGATSSETDQTVDVLPPR